MPPNSKQASSPILSFVFWWAAVSLAVAQPGNLDPGFNPGANDHVYALVALPDGKILVGGSFWGISGAYQGYVVRLLEDGSLDPGFHSPFPALSTGPVTALAVMGDGRILVAGQLHLAESTAGHAVFRLLEDGSLDSSFVANTDQLWFASGVAAYGDGRVLVTAWNTGYPGVLLFGADGALESDFTPGLGAGGLAVTIFPNDKAVVGGTFGLVRVYQNGAVGSFGPPVEGPVSALAQQTDGRLVAGGGFTSVGGVRRVGVARFEANGQLDPRFDPGDGPDGVVNTVAVQADGKVVIGGAFTTVAGIPRNRIARLLNQGQLDLEFEVGAGTDHEVRALALDSGGRTVLGGLFTRVEGQPRSFLARLTADGSRNPGFIEVTAPSLEVPEDTGSVTIGLRRFSGHSGSVSVRVSALPQQALPGVDFVFDPIVVRFGDGETNATVTVPLVVDTVVEETEAFTVAIDQPEGGATLGDARETQVFIGNDDCGVAMRFAETEINEIVGNVRVGLSRRGITGIAFAVEFLIESEHAAPGEDYLPIQGTIEFGPDDAEQIIEIPILDDQLAEGEESFVVRLLAPSAPASLIDPVTTRVRLRDNDAPGGVDPDFAPGLSGVVLGLARQSDGALLVLTNSATRPLRLRADGEMDPGYSPNVSNVTKVFLSTHTNRLVYVTTNRFDPINHRVGRLLADGSLDLTFNASAATDGLIRAMLELPDHRLLVAGQFAHVNGENRPFLARLLDTGELDSGFDARLVGSMTIYALASHANGEVLIGGQFSSVAGTQRRGVARLLTDGTVDPGFLAGPVPGANQRVLALAVQGDDRVLVGGEFTTFNGQNRAHLVRLERDGELDLAFARTGPLLIGTGMNQPTIEAIRIQSDGRILVSGKFSQILGETRYGLARLLPGGELDSSFDPGPITWRGTLQGIITALELGGDGYAFIGGQFSSVGGASRNHLARLYTEFPSPAPLRILSTSFTLDGQVRVRFKASAPGRYALEASASLGDWQEIVLTEPVSGEGSVLDSAPAPNQRFYRMRGPQE